MKIWWKNGREYFCVSRKQWFESDHASDANK
jgi:hypothetical protein